MALTKISGALMKVRSHGGPASRINSSSTAGFASAVGSGIGVSPADVSAAAQKAQSTKLLAYPIDGAAVAQGHYIIFQIHSTQAGKLAKSSGLQSRTFTLQGQSKRVGTQIALYMPPSVSVTYKADYEDVEIGILAERGGKVINAFGANKEYFGAGDAMAAGARGGAEGLIKMGIGAADTLAPGAKALTAIKSGRITSSKMELLFKGVARRQYQYDFMFIPKSQQESIQVDQIVSSFKNAMLPTYVSSLQGTDSDKTISIPTTMDIKYFYQEADGIIAENLYLNKISFMASVLKYQ